MAIQAAEDGSRFTFAAFSPIEEEPAGNANGVQIFADRASQGGWSAKNIATRHEQAVAVSVGEGQEYRLFSPDLAHAVVQPFGHTPLAENVLAPNPDRTTNPQTVYLRDNATGLFEPLVTREDAAPTAKYGDAAFAGANPSLSSIVFRSDEPLTTESSEPGGLFAWRSGHLKLIGRKAGLGNGYNSFRNAISADGVKVIWTEGGRLEETDLTTGATAPLDESQGGKPAQPQEHSEFEIASADATKVFFRDSEPLTPDAHGGYDLYEYDLKSGRLANITASLNPGEGAGVQGVLGASEDGSQAYFVATGALAGGATAGEYNFYQAHETGSGWSVSLVATVSSDDNKDWQFGFGSLANVASRVSPDGRYLAFMSDRPLTGYDNRDAVGGQRDEEVFLYTAGRLTCVSCNPTGARPHGRLDQGSNLEPVMIDGPNTWSGRWLAANIPGWTGYDLSDAEYQSRYLDDSGRMFFNSVDPLVPQDTNGKADVYEFEPDGVGSCKQAGGCVSLISSGISDEESAFLDASADGDDVFFLTLGKLAPEDADTALDVYDAHVCREAAPCTQTLPVPPPCVTADACRAAPTPQPAIYGAPASATFSGAGNVTPVQAPAKRSKSVQKRPHRSASCKRKPRRRRAACERRAKRGRSHKANATKKGNR
jgi:cell division septation protein DedD